MSDTALHECDSGIRTTVVIDAEVKRAGDQRAKELRRNFSNYLTVLIEEDVRRSAEEKRREKEEAA